MQNAILDKINKAQEKKRPRFGVGDKVNVFVRLKEGDKERVQAFRGTVIAQHPKSAKGPGATFTVRKISEGVGVERVFPVHSPVIEKIEVEATSIVRRSRLFYLRELKGKKARLKDGKKFADLVAPEETAPIVPELAPGVEATLPGAAVSKEEDKKA
jgi:large subunit ribosomal protein L19